jgi:hypothetical protein
LQAAGSCQQGEMSNKKEEDTHKMAKPTKL